MLSRPWGHQKLDCQWLFSIQITVIEFPPPATSVKCLEVSDSPHRIPESIEQFQKHHSITLRFVATIIFFSQYY